MLSESAANGVATGSSLRRNVPTRSMRRASFASRPRRCETASRASNRTSAPRVLEERPAMGSLLYPSRAPAHTGPNGPERAVARKARAQDRARGPRSPGHAWIPGPPGRRRNPREEHRAALRAPVSPLRREQARPAHRASGHGYRREGRHDPPRHVAAQSVRLPRQGVQGAHRGRARARFSLARPPGGAPPRRFRDLQPVALRGRDRRARARAQAPVGLGSALRPDQRVRAASGRERRDDPQILPAYQQGRAEETDRATDQGSDETLEARSIRLRGTQVLERLPAGV